MQKLHVVVHVVTTTSTLPLPSMSVNDSTKQAAISHVARTYAFERVCGYMAQLVAEDNGKGCFIPIKLPRVDGYVRITVTQGDFDRAFVENYTPIGKEETFYLHHVAWYAFGNDVPRPVAEHLSHLCGDPRCFNPCHLVIESPKMNNQRKGCKVAVRCTHCGHVIKLCDHMPGCIPLAALKEEME